MDKLMTEAVEVQRQFTEHTDAAKELGPKRNKLVARLAKKYSKAEIATALNLTSQRIIQILKKENGETDVAKASAE